MKRPRVWSIALLIFSSFAGTLRGLRMIFREWDSPILFPFPEDKIQDSVYSSYPVLGMIVLSMVGVFSMITLVVTIRKAKLFPYLLIIEGIFMLFLTLSHMIYVGASFAHVFVMSIAISLIALGIRQSPREF
jgi:presenilin-like A22 family membrane protease